MWPWWIGAAALAAIMFGHWWVLGRTMAVSGRYTALVNRLRHGPAEDEDLSPEELVELLRAATEKEFGAAALEPAMIASDASGSVETKSPALPPPGFPTHFFFLGGVLLGGLLSSLLAGTFAVTFGLRGELLGRASAIGGPSMAILLMSGGVLVGFGTRMASGCTSGHGLCGVSRFQLGSLAATASFFGLGVATSFVLERLL